MRTVSKMMASERTANAVRDDLTRRFPANTYEVRFNGTTNRYYVVITNK